MAATLIWSSESLDDIDAIAQFIGRDSPHHAQRVVEGLLELGESITAHPLGGRVVPELGDVQVRERFLYSYRLIYEVRPDRIEVLAVLHGRRLLESIGERFEG
ncbi:type II toxin-antitoxin system RelE/ParE family toxin [Metallibacterium sp.]